MNILVLGSGGREHTLVWKLSHSPRVKKIFCVPGNAGIAAMAQTKDLKLDDFKSLVEFAMEQRIDLTIVGPETPLVNGIVDEFRKKNLKIFGPPKNCARLEGSKIFAKLAMGRFGVPTANFKIFDDIDKAVNFVKKVNTPIVVKADGLCAGKGVIIAETVDEAISALELMMNRKIFGAAGNRVIVEECLKGEEASILAFCDGKNILPLASSQDHKRIFDGDKGPNTGGMGAYSPAPIITDKLFNIISKKVFNPIMEGLAKEGCSYKGVLYAGLMITKNGPMVLEFNVRFGDPETQAILPRLKTDLVDCIEACINGRLDKIKLKWDPRPCVCVVLASGGYPGEYKKGHIIHGLDEISTMEDVAVFHAGTKLDTSSSKKQILSDGGRVLGVTALGKDIKDAIDRTYAALNNICFENMHYRKDIGHRALKKKNAKKDRGNGKNSG